MKPRLAHVAVHNHNLVSRPPNPGLVKPMVALYDASVLTCRIACMARRLHASLLNLNGVADTNGCGLGTHPLW